MKILPPDATQQELANEINANLSSEAKVTFFRKQEGDDGVMHYGMIFEYGSARRVTQSPQPFFDPDAIVATVNRWIANMGQQNRWGMTP